MTRVVSASCMAAMLSFGMAAFAQTTGQSPTQPASQAGSQRMEQGRQSGDPTQTEQQMTLVGCIQREAEYRQAHEGGRGGTMGTGIGAGNEFVLVNASTASGSQTAMSGTGSPTGGTMPGSASAGTSGTSGTATGTTSGTGTTGSASGTTSGTGSTTSGTGSTTSGTGSPTSGTATGTTAHSGPSGMSMTSGGTAYALTGNRERELEQFVGQRVEIVGRIEGGAARGGSSTGYSGGTGSATGTTSGGSTTGSATGTTSGGSTTGSATGTTSGGSTTGSATGTTSGGSTTGSATGTTASGTTGGTAQGSASAGSRGQGFASLQQLNIVSFRAIGGSCTTQ